MYTHCVSGPRVYPGRVEAVSARRERGRKRRASHYIWPTVNGCQPRRIVSPVRAPAGGCSPGAIGRPDRHPFERHPFGCC